VVTVILDAFFGVVFLCLALLWASIGVFVLVTGRVPSRGWFLADWRRYRPRRAGMAMLGIAVLLALLGVDRLSHGRWSLAVGVLLGCVLLAIFIGWLVVTWKRANRAWPGGE